MTVTKLWRWAGLGIILLGASCNWLSPTPTAVSPTRASTPTSGPPVALTVSLTKIAPSPTPMPLSAAALQATVIARSPVAYTSIFIQENLAFLSYGQYLVILDVSTPSQPTLVSKTPLQNQIKRIQAAGNAIYVVLETRDSDETKIGLQIIDITDPSNPSEQGFYRPGFLAVDAVVIDDVAHVVGADNRWDVVDVSNPNAPIKIGTILEGNVTGCMGGSVIIYGIKEIEGYLHLSSGRCRYGGESITVFDASTPLSPEQVGLLAYPHGRILDIAYRDNDAYTFASYGGTFLRILDVSDRSKPGIVGDLSIPRPGYSLGDGRLVVIDHYVYVASSEGLYVIDVSDRFQPRLVKTLYPQAYFSDMVAANGCLYLVDWDNGLLILDVSDPANPVKAGDWQQ